MRHDRRCTVHHVDECVVRLNSESLGVEWELTVCGGSEDDLVIQRPARDKVVNRPDQAIHRPRMCPQRDQDHSRGPSTSARR